MRNFRTNYIITGVIQIILGVLTMRYPLEAIMSAGVIIGIGLVASRVMVCAAHEAHMVLRLLAGEEQTEE